MNCANCGKENPQGAMFCAFCGNKLITPESAQEQWIEGELLSEAPAHEPFMRPDPAKLVTPLSDNPAQPARRAEPIPAPAREETEADMEDPPPRRLRRREEPLMDSAVKPAEKTNAPEKRPARASQVDAAGRTVPERKPPVAPRKKAGWTPPNTLVPRRKTRREDDLFFEKVSPGDDMYEEDENLLARRIKSAAAGVFLLAVLCFAFWLLVLPGGQVLRARMGMGAPASAYAALGEQYLNEGGVKKSADAFYEALRLDPDNYDYALRVAQTQEMIGDRERALAAYAKCMSLKPSEPEPYRAVAEIYSQAGDSDRARNALKTGYDRSGDLELFRLYEQTL